MVPRILPIFFVILLTAESRPFYGMGGRRTSDSQKVWNLDGAHPAYYPLLPFPVQQSGMFSDFSRLPISQSSLQFSDILNRVRKDKISSSGSSDRDLQDFDEKTAQMVDQFGHRVRATVRQYEKAHDQGMQNVGKIMEQFNLDEVKDRLKKTLMDKKALLKKLHSIGWRGKYIGVPYDTMNDDHRIVKKPGVYSISLSRPNAVLVAPAIQPIPVQHPVLPEVTTSVYFHQEPEPTATVDDYVHPTEVNETTEISNLIDDSEKLTIIDTTTSMETAILEEDTRETPFSETDFFVSVDSSPETEDKKFYATLSTDLPESSPRTQDESATTDIGPTYPSTITIVHEENTSLEIEGYTTATEIIPKYSPTFLTEITPGTEETSLPASETSTVPSSTTRSPRTTSHFISTFPSIFPTDEPVPTSDQISAITDDKFDLVIDGEEREPTMYSPLISSESTSWPTRDSLTPVEEVLSTIEYNTSPSFPDAVKTSSTLLFSAIPTETTTAKVDGEEITEIISTSTEESGTLEEVTITTEPAYDPFVTDGATIAYSTTTSTSSIPSETTFWQPITSEATTGVESTFYSTIPSTSMSSTFTEQLTTIESGEATTVWEETSTTSLAIDSETTGATSTVLNPAVYDPTFEIGIRHLETSSAFPTTIASQATTIFEEIPTTESSFYGSRTIDVGINTVLDDLTVFEGNYLTSPAIEVETTTVIDLKLFSTNPIESVTVEAGSSTTLDSAFDPSRIGTDSTTETPSISQSTILTEKTTSLEAIFEIEDSYFGIPTIGVETTTEILLPFHHTIPEKTTTAFDELFTTTTESIDNSMIDEGTTETSSTLSVTVLTKATTNSNPEFDTLSDGLPRFVDYSISSTTEVETTTVVDSTVYSTTPIESMTIGTESLTPVQAASESSTIVIEITTETGSTSQSTTPTDKTTIFNESPETGYSYFDIPTIEDKTAAEILSPFSSTIPIETTISTATEFQVDSLTTEEGTSEFTTPFPVTVTTVETTTSGFEETPGSDGSTRFEGNYLQTSSSIEVETSTVPDSTFFSTSESPATDIESTTETASTFQSPISTEKTTVLEKIPAITDAYFGIPPIGVETTKEILLPFSHTSLTQSTTAFDQLSTTTTETLIDNAMIDYGTTESISTLQNKATTASNQKITTLSDYIQRFVDNYPTDSSTEVGATTVVDSRFYLPNPTEPITMATESLTTIDSAFESSTIDIESTTETPSTSQSPISTEETTTLEEIPGITDSYFGIPTIDDGTTPEILSPFFYSNTVPKEPTLTFDEPSTTTMKSPVGNSIIDEETTEVMATFYAPSEPTTSSASEITTLPDILPRLVNNYLTSSTTDTESTAESVTTPFEKATTLEERSTTDSLLDTSTIDTGTYARVISSSNEIFTTTTDSSITSLVTEEEVTGEVYSIFSTAILTDIVQITTVDPKPEGSTIDAESTSGIVSTISLPIPTEKSPTLEDISATTGLPLESSTIHKETTTVIIPTETTTSFEDVSEATDMVTNGVTDDGETTTEIVSTFSTETSVEPASVYDFEARSASGDLDENAIEEPDVKTLLNLIPLIIEELRKNNLSTAEVYTLRQVFGNIWPLLEEESKRKPGESVNHKLAILLYEAGQRLSNID